MLTYGEGAVPPVDYLFCQVLVTIGGTAPSQYYLKGEGHSSSMVASALKWQSAPSLGQCPG